MNVSRRTVLCLDDEINILNSLKRLLRRESYRLLTASSGHEALTILSENEIHIVISDQRMPEMSGTEFLAKVKKEYPDVIRIMLTGYTDVDSITESINKGHIYKFFLKPWNDQNLKLEIRQAIDQYDLIEANKKLNEKILEQNEALKVVNEDLEKRVKERTAELEIQNQALELSHAILEDLPYPIIGVSAEKLIVLINRQALELPFENGSVGLGKGLLDFFSSDVEERTNQLMSSHRAETIKDYRLSEDLYDIDLTPLSGRFRGKGVVLTLRIQQN